jgi:PAS domain S-box-containing protein
MIPNLTDRDALDALLKALERAGIGCTVVVDDDDHDTIARVYANEPIARIFGVDVDAMRKLPPMDFIAPGERERIREMRTELIKTGQHVPTVETAILRPDGSSVPVEIGLAHVDLPKGRAVFVFLRDVSEKAKIQAALRDSERRFRSVAEASPDSIAIYKDGRYQYANPVALRILGVKSFDELQGVDSRQDFSPERREELASYLARVRRGEPMPPLLNRRQTAEGKDVLFESSVSVVSLDVGEVVISYSRDITERTHLQAELMKHDRLASVGILAAGVAHELNNPLTTVAMQARKLRAEAEKRDLPADVREGLEQIDEAAKRLSSIIGDLLFVARPSDRPQAHVDVAQILLSTVSLFRAGTPNCPPIEIATETLPPICGQASKLGQVVLNVLRNAAQAIEGTPNGKIRVSAAPSDDHIEIVIEDDGPGIHVDHLPRVMQPFFTTKQNGTGLGLWISHTLVTEHGGTLDVQSVGGRGTRVAIRLPINATAPAGA